ncbi:MAG TPA: serine/threonine-protein kinase [Nocardioides sp.]|nr:serine/threonine-protein kinase [Nocardioides sp.]
MSPAPHDGAPHDAPAPGDRVGPYRVVRQLGEGGMGTVHEAVDTALHRHVALKVIAPALAGDPGFRTRFVREAQAQASLDSPHVVQVFAHGEADGRLYIASQLVPDGDLGALLRRHGPPPAEQAVDLIAQVADGLAEAHRVGLVHRDIKPANVLLRNRGTDTVAYLADFGIASQVGAASTGSGGAGTPGYMAPELHRGGTAGPATDVYSLGCLLWATLAGRPPYPGTSAQVVEGHVSGPVPQLPGRTAHERELNRVLRTALAKGPAERYPSAAAFRDELRSLARTTPAAPRRRTALVAALVAAAAAGALALAVPAGLVPAGLVPAGLVQAPGGSGPDEDRAIATIARTLEQESDLDAPGARCTAEQLVAEHGVAGLQEQGLLDENLMLAQDANGDVDSQVLADIFATTFSCVWSSAAD